MLVKLTKFTIRGIVGTAIDTIVLLALSTYFFHSYFTIYILAPLISFEVSILIAYIICYFWIWNHRVHNNKWDFFRRIPAYNATVWISFVVKMILLISIERIFHFHVVICNLLALSVSGFINYFTSEKIIFKKKPMSELIKKEWKLKKRSGKQV
jgi:putative flippase GtrA